MRCYGLTEKGNCRYSLLKGASEYDWKCEKERCKWYSELNLEPKGAEEE